jgi:hypothetical protein
VELVKLDHGTPTAPTVTGGGDWTNTDVTIAGNADAADALSGIDPLAYEYQTSSDGAQWADAAAGGAGLTVSTEGTTLVRLRAHDLAGNAGAWSVPVPDGPGTAKIDTTAPAVPGITGTSGWTTAASVTAGIESSGDTLGATAASGLDHYMVRTSTDGGMGYGAPEPSVGTFAITAEGVTDVSAAACDTAGNCSAYSPAGASSRVSIDRTAPTEPGVAGGGTAWSNTPVSITNKANSTDSSSLVDPAGYEVQTSTDNGASWSAPQADQSHTVTVSTEGSSLVRFRSHDLAGNASEWTDPVREGLGSARIDMTAPAVPTVTGAGAWSKAASVQSVMRSAGDTLGAAASSGLAHYLARTSLNGGASYGAAKQTSGTLAVTAEGVSDVSAAACDAAGNCSAYSPVSATAKVSIDRTPPTIPVVTGGDGAATCTSYVASQTFTASATDALSGIYFYQSAGTNGTTPTGVQNGNPRTISATKITGRIQLQFVAVDNAGNVGSWSSLSNPGGIKCIG